MENANAEQQVQSVEGQSEQQVDVDGLAARLERLESSNQRLLDESKSWKSKYQNVKSEVEEQKTVQMQEANDFKGLYEKALEKLGRMESEVQNTNKSALETTLKYEIAKNAKDAEDTDILLAAVKMKKKDMLGFDKENRAWLGVKDAVEELRVSNPGLFIKERPGMINGRPQSAVPVEKTVDELIIDDPTAVLEQSLIDLLK